MEPDLPRSRLVYRINYHSDVIYVHFYSLLLILTFCNLFLHSLYYKNGQPVILVGGDLGAFTYFDRMDAGWIVCNNI